MNMFGTMGYAAPEALGYYDEDDNTIAYTMSVDIWAVGTIALTLLLGREVFPRQEDLSRYVNRQRPLGFSRAHGDELTDHSRDFITQMLTPDPVVRPTAIGALAHPWLRQAATPPPEDTPMHGTEPLGQRVTNDREDLLPSNARPIKQESPRRRPKRRSPYTKPRAPGNKEPAINLETEDKPTPILYPVRDPITQQRVHDHLALDSVLLTPKLRGYLSDKYRYFVLRSDNATDIESSAAHDVWCSSPRVNKILNKAYAHSGGHVLMLFSVVLSRKFCGVARITSALDWEHTDPHWVEDVCQWRFTLEWLSLTEISFDLVKHVPVKESTPGFRAISCYGGTEISRGSAWELLRTYSSEERRQGLLDSSSSGLPPPPPPAPASGGSRRMRS